MKFIKASLVLISLLGLVINADDVTLAKHQHSESGLKGRVKATVCRTNRQQTRVKCRLDEVHAEVIVKSANSDQEVTRFESDDNGRFKISLSPGEYRLSTGPGSADKTIFPRRIQVRDGKFTMLTILLNGKINISLSNEN